MLLYFIYTPEESEDIVTLRVSQMAVVLKNMPANAGGIKDQVWSLGREGPLEEGMATHSSIVDWRIPWTEKPEGLQSMGSQRVRQDWSDLARTRDSETHCW